jgi:hypothetical protein
MFWILAFEFCVISIGELHVVKSKFFQKIDAFFEFELDFNGLLEVGLGDSEDYTQLRLER